MFCPKLLRNAAIYNFNRTPDNNYEVIDAQEYADTLHRKYGISAKAPYKLHPFVITNFEKFPFLNNVEVGAYSKVKIGMEPSSVYCKLGEFSKFEIDGQLDNSISPYRCIAVIGGNFCRVSVHISAYNRFYRDRPDSDNPRFSTKERIDPAVTGIALKGGSFDAHFDISRSSIYMSIQRNIEDLYIYHQGELVAVLPPGLDFIESLQENSKWKWKLRKSVKRFLKERKDA